MGRWVARIPAVLIVGIGAGLVAWAISSAALHEPVRPLFGLEKLFAQASEILGWGAGLATVGITTLILSYLESDSYLESGQGPDQDNDTLWDD